jgi:hypothetical protein
MTTPENYSFQLELYWHILFFLDVALHVQSVDASYFPIWKFHFHPIHLSLNVSGTGRGPIYYGIFSQSKNYGARNTAVARERL